MTLAHPAAVLPLGRLGLPMTALVVGSMVPDVPLFMRWPDGYRVTHSLLGILAVDVVLALAVLLLWFRWIRDAAADMAPEPVRSRLAEHVRPTRLTWVLSPLAACGGAATHVAWDAFTHPHRWGPRHIEWLRTEHAGLPGLKWLQYASGIIGLGIVVWAGARHLRSLPRSAEPRGRPVLPASTLPAVVAGAGLVGLVAAIRRVPDGLHAMAFSGVVLGLVALTVLALLACGAWHVARRRSPDLLRR